MKYNGNEDILWWRVKTWEQANYRFTWPNTIASNSQNSPGFIEIQNAQQTYILQPQRDDILFHFFVGVYPASQLLYLQYPSSKDRNALAISRSVDGTGQGAIDGRQSQLYNPSVDSEILTMADLRPVYNIFNNSGATVTPQLWFYARMYEVDGPYLTGNKQVGTAEQLQGLIDTGSARIIGVYGTDLINVPSRIAQRVQGAN